jgi:hypothetical protein
VALKRVSFVASKSNSLQVEDFSSTKFIEKSNNNDLCVCFVCMALLLLVVSSANLVVHDKFDGKILACVEFDGNLISNSRTSDI